MNIRTLFLTLPALAVLVLPSCQTFDKEGTKPMVTLDSPADPVAVRAAIVNVFGSEGFTVVSQDGDPMVFSRPARMTDRLFYQDLDGNELTTQATVWVDSAASGTRIELMSQILHRPGTMFEDPKYPLLGTGSYYRKLLQRASLQAQGRTE